MEWTVFHILGVFIIFENCFSREKATDGCSKIGEDELKSIDDAINKLREKHHHETLKIKAAPDIKNAAAIAVLAYTGAPIPGLIAVNGTKAYSATDTVAQITKWIHDGKGYMGDKLPTDIQKPYVQMLWKATEEATCAKCSRGTDQKFGCLFNPAAIDALPVIQANLTPEPEDASKSGDDKSGDDKSSDNKSSDSKSSDENGKNSTTQSIGDSSSKSSKGTSSKTHFSKVEKTVRTLTLIAIFASISTLAFIFIIAILGAIKVFIIM